METLDIAMKIITGPWDVITWLIALMLGVSVWGFIYKLFTGKSLSSGATMSRQEEIEDMESFTSYMQRNSPLNMWYKNDHHL